jgi:tol-pal system protein YbgF
VLLGAVVLVLAGAPAYAQKKEIIQLQRDMAILQEIVRQVERQSGERMAVLENLINQNLEATNKLNAAIAVIERTVAKQSDNVVGPVTSTSTKVDSLQSQIAALRDSVDEMSARLSKVQQQVSDVKTHLTTLPPPSLSTDPQGNAGGPAAAFSSAETIFSAAFSDYTRGNYELARQQFSDYLKYYGNSGRAAEAQYYLGAAFYQDGDYAEAVRQFDMVLERYPVGVISPDAQYKKGLALVKLNRPDEAVREFRAVIEKFPNSNVAPNARAELEQLESSKPSPTARSQG